MTNTANLKRFSDRSEQILSAIKSGNRMSLEISGSLKEHLEAMTDKYSSVLTEAPENPNQGDKWFDGKSTWTYNGTAWLPEFVTPNKSYFSFAATATANTATDLTQEIEMADNDLYKVTLDLAVTDCGLSTTFVVKEDDGNGVKLWNGTAWATSGTIEVHALSGNLETAPTLTFVPVAKTGTETHNKFKIQITSATSLSCRGTATIDHLLSGAITDGAVYDPTHGGGGSGDGFQPDRVIVIDSSLTSSADDVPGKAYGTFTRAKTYMDANSSLEFQVELPAGTFAETVTIGAKYLIHGNNTTLTQPVASEITVDISNPDISGVDFGIEGCTIAGGFTPGSSQTDLALFTLRNCTVNNAGALGPVIMLCQSCIINSTASSYAIAQLYNSVIFNMSGYQVLFYNCITEYGTVTSLDSIYLDNTAAAASVTFTAGTSFHAYNSNIYGSITSGGSIYFRNCSVRNDSAKNQVCVSGNLLNFDNTDADLCLNGTSTRIGITADRSTVFLRPLSGTGPLTLSSRVDIVDTQDSLIDISNLIVPQTSTAYMSGGVFRLSANGSYGVLNVNGGTEISLRDSSTLQELRVSGESHITLGNGTAVATLYTSAVCDINDSGATITNNYVRKAVAYSDDGGTTILPSSSGATHIGFILEPGRCPYNVPSGAEYAWIPINS